MALLQAGLGRLDRSQACRPALNLCRNIQVRLIFLNLVGVGSLLHQCRNLGFEFGFSGLHARIAHRFVATGVGFYLGTVHRDSAQFDQPHLARQAHDLDKQIGELGQVQRPKVPDGAVGGEVVGTEYAKGNVLVQLLGDLGKRLAAAY